LKSALQEVTTKTVSMFAAISCISRPVPGARRLMRLLRSSTRLDAGPRASSSSQSPTVASGPGGIVSRIPSPSHLQAAAMHRDDAHRRRFGQRFGVDLLREGRAPAEALQRRGFARARCADPGRKAE
jgi:hypothetical protein